MATTPHPHTPAPTNIRTRTGRGNHRYHAPTIGRMFSAVFLQPLTDRTRTVEVIRYQGAEIWKARVVETGHVFCRLGIQCEYENPTAACRDITAFFTQQGMTVLRPWIPVDPHTGGIQ